MTGRVIIVTGASSGIGYETARYLCEGGNDVIFACRNEEKTNRAIDKLKRTNPNALATFMQLDLGDMESVHKFVEDFHATEKKLHILINNAGMTLNFKELKRQYTKDNFEITMGTNHLGPFLLTNLLLEDLKKTAAEAGEARIVNVASSIHDPETMRRRRVARDLHPWDLCDNFFLFDDATFNGIQAYKNSKLANIMFTYELARRLEGTGVTANCLCPGFIPSTDLQRTAGGMTKFMTRYLLHGMLRFTKITRSTQQGGMAVCNLATEEKYKEVTGKYIKDGAEIKSSPESLDEEKQKKLWELSGGYTKLEGYEPIEVPPPPVEEEPKVEEPKEEEAANEEKTGENEEKAAEEDGGNKEKEDTKAEEESTEKEDKEQIKKEEEQDNKIDVKEEKIEETKEEEEKKE